MRPTIHAHQVVRDTVRDGETVVDATAGNGYDTLFLANTVGSEGRVVAFDIQKQAISSSRSRLESADLADRVSFHCESHARLGDRVLPGVAAIMFNLGYLPGGDHELITRTGETLVALDAAYGLLREGGVLTVVCYPGHQGGDSEAKAVVEWSKKYDAEVHPQAREGAPFLVVVRR